MTAAEVIQPCDFDGVKLALTPEGKLHYSGKPHGGGSAIMFMRDIYANGSS